MSEGTWSKIKTAHHEVLENLDVPDMLVNELELCITPEHIKRMSNFKGFDLIPTTSLGNTLRGTIRIIVSAKRVSLPKSLIDAMGQPSSITFHKGLDGNEGKIIIGGAAEEGMSGLCGSG